VKIRRRAAKARAIEEKAHNAGKVEGETFRKVFTTYLITNVSTKDKKRLSLNQSDESITERTESLVVTESTTDTLKAAVRNFFVHTF